MTGIGTDIEDIARFEELDRETHRRFLQKIYTDEELSYCFSKRSPAQHLAVRFCAKESVVKALSSLGFRNILYPEIRIRQTDSAPGVDIAKGSTAAECTVALTMSHAGGLALAFALATTA